MKYLSLLLLITILSLPIQNSEAAEVKIAVAANFTATAKKLVRDFEKQNGGKLVLSFGSTGNIYNQIINGAPYEMFLSADALRPKKLEKEGFGVPGSRFTYALGKLVLWTMKPDIDIKNAKALKDNAFSKLAIANPKTAPYGQAAIEILKAIGVETKVKNQLVFGENVAQTYQFTATRTVDIGFVAKAQTIFKDAGSIWEAPQNLYTPIQQQAILLKRGKDNKLARAFLKYLKSAAARKIIAISGYGLEKD